MIDYQNVPTPPAKKSGGSPVMMIVSGVLVVALIAVGVLYGMEVGKVNKANQDIKDLQGNVSSLTTQLNTEKATVSDLTTQLATEKAKSASLQTQLDTTKTDLATANTSLTAANAKVTDLTTQLATANASVTSLTASLATANAKVTSTQASLDLANANLAVANSTITTQTAALTKMQYPQLFSSLSELQAWLAKDDSYYNPAYASYNNTTKCLIRQIKAARDGYLLPAYLDWDSTYYYFANTTMIGGMIVYVYINTNNIVTSPANWVPNPPPLHPLPLP